MDNLERIIYICLTVSAAMIVYYVMQAVILIEQIYAI